MPINYFPNATEAELVALLESLQRRLTRGEVYLTTYAGDQQMKIFQGAPKVATAIKWVLYSLSLLNSDYANPWSGRVRRTQISYW